MTVVEVAQVAHRLLDAVASVRAELATVAQVQPLFAPVEVKVALVAELAAARAQLAELELRVLAACGDAAAAVGARDIAAWWQQATPLEARTARATLRLAHALDDWPQVAQAMATGQVSTEQASVITTALAQAAPLLTHADRARAEELIVTAATGTTATTEATGATGLDPARLRVLGRHLAALVGAEDGAAADAARLAAQEATAEQRARLTFHPHNPPGSEGSAGGEGMTRITALVPDAVAHRLRTCLEAFAQPRKTAHHADGTHLPYPTLLAHALRDLLERLDPTTLPTHGGDATTVLITLTLDQLRTELATADLGLDGDQITAAQARRLACTATLIPVVLGGPSEILDLGRSTRLHTPAMRKALRLRDKHCRAEGCRVPATWCQAHHLDPWASGGTTNTTRGTLLCAHHHQRAHDPAYHHTTLPNGDHRFHRRT